MLEIRFEYDQIGAGETLHPLELGHVSFIGPLGTVTTRRGGSRTVVYLLDSVSDLLCELPPFLRDARTKRCVYSTFGVATNVVFEKRKGDRVHVSSGKTVIGVVPLSDVYTAVKTAALDFRDRWRDRFTSTEGDSEALLEDTLSAFDACLDTFLSIGDILFPR